MTEPQQPPSPESIVEIVARTDVGRVREHNEDSFVVLRLDDGCRDLDALRHHRLGDRGTLLLVCDGMGGAAAGEVASSMAIESVAASLLAASPSDPDMDLSARARQLRSAIEKASEDIFVSQRQIPERAGMGTTLTAVLLLPGHAIIAEVGDSRAYVRRDGRLVQVTRDQSLLNQLLDAGTLSPEQAKDFQLTNVIVQALGVQDRVEVQLSKIELRRGDRILVCSDGLVVECDDDQIAPLVGGDSDLAAIADSLIQLANDAGGADNTTVILAVIDEGPVGATTDPLRYERWRLDNLDRTDPTPTETIAPATDAPEAPEGAEAPVAREEPAEPQRLPPSDRRLAIAMLLLLALVVITAAAARGLGWLP